MFCTVYTETVHIPCSASPFDALHPSPMRHEAETPRCEKKDFDSEVLFLLLLYTLYHNDMHNSSSFFK